MNSINGLQLPDFLSNVTPMQIVGVAFVVIFLFKKLIKWAIILGALFIVVIPYLNDNGTIEQIRTKLGF